MFATILSIALVALTPTGKASSGALAPAGCGRSSASALLGGGGPDAYGYRYLDSDTTAPGAPTYNWVSIKGVGTKVTGLGDDNCVGPFPIGFVFPYYWYNVSTCVVGSNGYITFGDKSANAMGFRPVPSTNKPNNQLAVFLSDLDPTDTGSSTASVWYWSNGADSFIVEYDSVQFWSTGGNNTFQIILTKADSSITYQYKEQSGTPNLGWTDTCNQTGIENISGAIGVNYLSGTTPSGNAIHPGLAVRFFPPESTSLQIHDAGVRNAMNDRNGGVFAVNGRPLSFFAVVKNYGNQPEAEYKTFFKVQRQNGSVLFADSMTAAASNPGETESLALASTGRPTTNGVYVIKVVTKMTGDMLAANDTATIELRVLTIPGTLTYDSGTPTDGVSWGSAGGMGDRFVPPVYPCSISAIRQYVTPTGTANVLLAIYDDDGPGEAPGTVLFADTVAVTAADWYSVTLPTPVVIADGAFFVGGTTQDSGVTYGVDGALPVSYQEWENVGGVWSPGRFATVHDACANATISGPVGILESREPTPVPMPARIDANPNPFGGTTTIRLLNPTGLEKSIEIYDATGSIVRTLELSRDRALLDGRHLAAGVYFARAAGTEAPVAKVVVTR